MADWIDSSDAYRIRVAQLCVALRLLYGLGGCASEFEFGTLSGFVFSLMKFDIIRHGSVYNRKTKLDGTRLPRLMRSASISTMSSSLFCSQVPYCSPSSVLREYYFSIVLRTRASC